MAERPSLNDRWTLPAEPAAVAQLRDAAARFAHASGADEELSDAVRLAVTEAVTNAVIHGFVGRSPGTVTVAASRAGTALDLHVIDNGRGMRPRLDSPGLRLGLSLIAQLTSALEIHEPGGGGTEIRMTFTLPSHPAATENSG
jgi:serine/threonine-protein kinase RsbW